MVQQDVIVVLSRLLQIISHTVRQEALFKWLGVKESSIHKGMIALLMVWC